MSLDDKKRDRLATRTVQIIGFGTAFVLIFIKLLGNILNIDFDIPYIVIIATFGFGASADLEFLKLFLGVRKK